MSCTTFTSNVDSEILCLEVWYPEIKWIEVRSFCAQPDSPQATITVTVTLLPYLSSWSSSKMFSKICRTPCATAIKRLKTKKSFFDHRRSEQSLPAEDSASTCLCYRWETTFVMDEPKQRKSRRLAAKENDAAQQKGDPTYQKGEWICVSPWCWQLDTI